MGRSESHLSYAFGDFRLDAERRLLYARDGSGPLVAKPKVVEALLYFVERPGVLLEKDQLLADLWPGLVVEENNLTQVVSSLRRLLGETRGENRYLLTETGRGYRFVAEVALVPAPESSADGGTAAPQRTIFRLHRARYVALIALAGAAVIAYAWVAGWRPVQSPVVSNDPSRAGVTSLPARSVAILPFQNLSTDPADAFLAFGIAESLLHRLAGNRDVTVTARTSSFAFQHSELGAPAIGSALNARYLVEGSVQRAGSRLRITAQLIDAASGTHLWSLQFDRPLEDVFRVEDEIAQRVAEALSVSLSGAANPHSEFGTEAYLLFLEGQALLASRRIVDAESAIAKLSRAVELAPRYAAAHAALANAHRHHAYLFQDRPEGAARISAAREKALPALARALEIDGSLGEAYVMRADWHAHAGELEAAERDYRKGLALSPNFGVGHLHFAEFLDGQLGRSEEALAELDLARRVDPMTPRIHYYKGLIHLLRGESAVAVQEAEALFLQALQVAPDFHPALLRLSQIHWRRGQFAEAIRLAEQAVAIDPEARWMRRFLVNYYLEISEVDAARSVILQHSLSVDPVQWLPICLYERQYERAAGLVRADLNPESSWISDGQLAAFAIRDAARAAGELLRAQRELLRMRPDPRNSAAHDAYRLATLAQVYSELGDRRKADELANQVIELLRSNSSERFSHARAVALAVLRKPEAAMDTLELGFARGSRPSWWYSVDREPAFDGLRRQVRFETLTQRVRAHAAEERRRLQGRRARGELPERHLPVAANRIC